MANYKPTTIRLDSGDELIDVLTIAAMLNVKPSAVRSKVGAFRPHVPPAMVFGKRLMWRRSDVQAFFSKREGVAA